MCKRVRSEKTKKVHENITKMKKLKVYDLMRRYSHWTGLDYWMALLGLFALLECECDMSQWCYMVLPVFTINISCYIFAEVPLKFNWHAREYVTLSHLRIPEDT